MALAPGTRFGNYEVMELVGLGGMGEVYRGRDHRLERVVALKVLPESSRLDREALERFNREALLLASVNHPNIATLHGLENIGDSQVLVMEFVDGETLDQRIARAQGGRGLALDDALDIAEQIAAALDDAHQHGIVHRDLKPQNIKVRSDGTVKVLDFGIAKALSREGRGSVSNTVTSVAGAVIGTPSYMSPEQAAGGAVDRKTDIWAFGCLLYEMLTGQRTFDGDSSSRILARVIERDPDYDLLPPRVPPRIRRLLGQCLEKDPRKRRRDAGDIRLEIHEVRAEPDTMPEAPSARAGVHPLWLAAALLLGVAASAFAFYLSKEPPLTRYSQIATPSSRSPDQLAVSPDGRYVAYVATVPPGTLQGLYLWDSESGEERRIANTEGAARYPFWSPDGQSIGYFDSENLYRIDIDGGDRTKLAPSQNGLGGSWGVDGTIVYTSSSVVPLYRVSASAGPYEPVTKLEPGEANHRFPSFLPDGERFLFQVTGDPSVSGIYLGSLDGSSRRLLPVRSAAVFMAPDWMVYAQNDTLVASRLDLDSGELTGQQIELADLIHDTGGGYLPFSASAGGTLAYRDTAQPASGLTTYGADGQVLAFDAPHNGPDLSWDDRLLGYDTTLTSRDVWIWDLALEPGSGARQITYDSEVEGYPVFYPGDQYLVYEKQRDTDEFFELWTANPNRPGQQSVLYGLRTENLIPMDISATEYILYRKSDADFLSSDLEALQLSVEDGLPRVVGDPIRVANSRLEERLGAFSPDGALVAFDAFDPQTRRSQIFVQTFPSAGDVIRVPTDNGIAPRFQIDREGVLKLYFFEQGGMLMSSVISVSGGKPEVATPISEFPTEIGGQAYNHQYDVTRDGRFFVETLEDVEHPGPITLITNWRP